MTVTMSDQPVTNYLLFSLYDHFEKKLDMAVERYGRDRMSLQVNKLREQLRDVEEKCVDVIITLNPSLTLFIHQIYLCVNMFDRVK